MSDLAPKYRKLPGTGFRQFIPSWAMVMLFLVIGIFVLLLRGRRVQLWQGDDHLLVVEWNGYSEFYKRIRFSDIQWVSVHRTDEYISISGIIGTLALVCLVVGIVSPDNVARMVFLTFAGIALALLTGNLVAGPTCKVFLGTAVQVEEMVSLKRLRKANKVLDILRPGILASQAVGGTTIERTSQSPVPAQAQATPAPGQVQPNQPQQ